jgi:hypothetical protein
MAIFRNTILKKEDFQKLSSQYGSEVELLLNTLNGMFSQLHTMLAGGLNFGENVQAEIRTVAVAAQQKFPINVKHNLGRLPQGVIVLKVKDDSPQGGSKTGSGSKTAYTGEASPANQQSVAVSFTPQSDSISIDSFGAIDQTHKYSITIMIV